MISKTFYQQLRSSERQSLVGPPESMREHVVAASKAMRNGNWSACKNFVINEKMNAKVMLISLVACLHSSSSNLLFLQPLSMLQWWRNHEMITSIAKQRTSIELVKIYRVSQEECARLREDVPYVKVYRYNTKHLCPKLNGYGDNGQRKV